MTQQKAVSGCTLVILLTLLGGCAAPGYKAIQDQPGDLPERAAVENVPFYPQEDYYCGPASLAMMLNWAGIPVTQEESARQVYTPGRQGTFPVDLLSGARRNGVLAVEVASLRDLLGEIAAGHPVLVFQNLGFGPWPQWHFAVAHEYELASETLVLHSGLNSNHVTNLNAFERTWARADYWAVTITKPDHLPARADVNAVISAAAGLERAGKLTAAATAYETIIRRWPDNLAARMGLGNVMYARDKFSAASKHYRAAIAINPEYAPAWNNLAYALSRLGHKHDAIDAAERAVALGEDNNDDYKDTLREMRNASKPAG